MIGQGLLGIKLGMTHVYTPEGKSIAVTAIDVSENDIIQVKTKATDGYSAIQVGLKNKKASRTIKPEAGHFKKYGKEAKYFVREFRFDDDSKLPAADKVLDTTIFEDDQFVDVIGITKGRGFAGGMKRHNFSGQRQTHGSMMHRRTGAIGCRLTPGRVWKNQRMPGHMGDVRCTVQNLKVVGRREEDGVLLISGSIPGAIGSMVAIRPAKKRGTPAEEAAKSAARKEAAGKSAGKGAAAAPAKKK
jgi:large subunit ribosomal protein L3